MKAIVVHNQGGTPKLVWEEADEVACGPDEVVVDVHATAVNRADLLQAKGLYPPPPGDSETLGLELAGVIHEVGVDVSQWMAGDRIIALAPGGGYAEQARVHHGMLLPLPDTWSFEKGAAIPEVWLTAYSNLFVEGGLRAGETVLIHAGASGVGTAAIQLARAAGARAVATAGSEAKVSKCLELGAAVAINYNETDFGAHISAQKDNPGVDLILDCVGGAYFSIHLQLLNPYGRLVNIGLLGGGSGEMDMTKVLMKSLRIIGSRLRARTTKEKTDFTRGFEERFWPLLLHGTLQPVVDSVYDISEADAAHAYVGENRNIGKVILTIKKN